MNLKQHIQLNLQNSCEEISRISDEQVKDLEATEDLLARTTDLMNDILQIEGVE